MTRRHPVENAEYAEFTRRILKAMGTRAGADVDSLAELVKLRDEVDGQLVRSVLACHAAGYSWADIGDRLGITRQAAFKRFAPLAERDAISGRAPLTPPNRTVGI